MLGFLSRYDLKTDPYIWHDSVMGSVAYQQVYGLNGPVAADKAGREMHRLNALWSPYFPGNIIDTVSKAAGRCTVAADSDTLQLLQTAKELALPSQGALDITVDPLICLWRMAAQQKVPPRPGEIEKKRNLVCISDLQITSGGHIWLPRHGQGLDLGGIGKGFTADRVREIYRKAGIRHAVLNIGGNVMLLGSKPNGTPWKVGIRNPALPHRELVGYIEAEDCAVVTSGDYEQFFDYTDPLLGKRRLHHIIDPRSGWPADSGISGVTIVAASSALADGLATAALVLGLEKGMALCNSFTDTHALMISNKGELHMTQGMSGLFQATRETIFAGI